MASTHQNGTSPHQTPTQHKDAGNHAYDINQLDNALHHFTAAIEQLNDTAETANYEAQLHAILYSNRSAIYLEQYNFTAALTDANHAIHLDPHWFKPYVRQAQAYEGLEQFDEAIQAYQTAQTYQCDTKHQHFITDRLAAIHSIQQLRQSQQQAAESTVINHIELNERAGDNERYENMVNWLKHSTTTQFNKLYIKSYTEDSRGVCALQPIHSNEVILQVPLQYIITSEIARSSDIGQQIIATNISLNSSHTYLACYLLFEKYVNPSSRWLHYIQCLPQSYSNMPIFFAQSVIDIWLQGSFTVQKINDRKSELYDEYTNLCSKISTMKQFTLDQFIWARLVVITRIFGLVINERKTDGLVPLADLLNHKRPRETSWNFDDATQCFTIVSLCSIDQYAPVYDSYGRKCNSRFFVNYGFSLDNNFDDNNAVMYIPLHDGQYDNYALRCRIYGISGAAAGEKHKRFQISTDWTEKTTKEMWSLCRLFHANTTELITLQQDNELNNKDLAPLSLTNELAVLKCLAEAAQVALAQFSDSLDVDYDLLQRHRSGVSLLDDNVYNCVVQRRGEKEVLHWYVQLYAHMAALADMNVRNVKKYVLDMELGRAQMDKYMRDVLIPLMRVAQRPG